MILASNMAAAGGGSSMIVLMVGLFIIMYVMMIRPQRKEQQRMQEMLGAMEVGDAVMTSSGFYGIVIDISEEDVIVEFGNNKNCRIPMKKEAISKVEKPGDAFAPAPEKKEGKGIRKLFGRKEEPAAKETGKTGADSTKSEK